MMVSALPRSLAALEQIIRASPPGHVRWYLNFGRCTADVRGWRGRPASMRLTLALPLYPGAPGCRWARGSSTCAWGAGYTGAASANDSCRHFCCARRRHRSTATALNTFTSCVATVTAAVAIAITCRRRHASCSHNRSVDGCTDYIASRRFFNSQRFRIMRYSHGKRT